MAITEDDVRTYIGALMIDMLSFRKEMEALVQENAQLKAELEKAKNPPPKPPLNLVK